VRLHPVRTPSKRQRRPGLLSERRVLDQQVVGAVLGKCAKHDSDR
jgi:hypothetical protein